MKRYPHIAIVSIETGGSVVNGEYRRGIIKTFRILGRYETGDNKSEIIRHNRDGKEVKVKALFYTKYKRNDNAVKLSIADICNDVPIIVWDDFQSHSIIGL